MRASYARHMVLASLLAICLPGCPGAGQHIGLMIGDPTGISFKENLDKRDAVAAGVGLGFVDGSAFHAHMDYIRILSQGEPDIHFYGGVGVRLRARTNDKPGNDRRDKFDLGPRVPIGVQFDLSDPRAHIFLEFAPGVDVIHPKAFVDFAVGIRFPF